MTQLTLPDKLRNRNHDIEGQVNDGQRVTWTANLVMFLRENNFEAIVGGFRDVGKENLSIFHHQRERD